MGEVLLKMPVTSQMCVTVEIGKWVHKGIYQHPKLLKTLPLCLVKCSRKSNLLPGILDVISNNQDAVLAGFQRTSDFHHV